MKFFVFLEKWIYFQNKNILFRYKNLLNDLFHNIFWLQKVYQKCITKVKKEPEPPYFRGIRAKNVLLKLRDFESFTLSKRSKIGISYIYFSIYLIFPIYYHIKLYHKCITTLTFMIHLLHFFNMLILYHTFDL